MVNRGIPMIHTSKGTLVALLDGELSAADRSGVEHHLSDCPVCTAEMESLREISANFSVALRLLDSPAPPLDDTYRAVLRERARRQWKREFGRSLRRAAILVLGVAGVASATIPGSPVRDWAIDLWDRIEPGPERAVPMRTDAPAGVDAEVSPTGVSILPADGRVLIALQEPAPALEVRVRISDGGRAEVRATGEAVDARFRIAPGRIEVVGASAGILHIDLPRSARSAAIEIGGKPYLVKDGDQLRVLAPSADRAGAEVIFRIGRQSP